MEPMFEASNKRSSIAMKKPLKASPPVVLSQDIPPGTKLTFVDIAHNLATINIESKMNHFRFKISRFFINYRITF